MEGLYILSGDDPAIVTDCGASRLRLLLKRRDLEIMQQTLHPSSSIWLSPADDPEMVEYFIVLAGQVTLMPSPNEARTLGPGDGFFIENIKTDIRLVVHSEAQVLYVTNRPVYDTLTDFRDNYEQLLKRIDQKDNITLQHSRNVLNYCIAIYTAIHPDGVSMDDMALAALFHDVGKCNTPDEILKKRGKLTAEEYGIMQQHATHSYNMLLPGYGARIAEIALQHHERLDGSGYPRGISGERIGMPARIMAVADAFDAMTSARPYNTRKTPETAIAELYTLTHQYERDVIDALRSLYLSGQLMLSDQG